MSLDVYLTIPVRGSGASRQAIFVRREGANVEITREEWDRMSPGVEPIMATVNAGDDEKTELFTANITHNLGKMADAAGIYHHLWRPEEIGISHANQLIEPLEAGLSALRSDPSRFSALNPENGWGSYEGLIQFVTDYLAACRAHPDANVGVWR